MADFRKNPLYQAALQQGVVWGLSRLTKWNRDKLDGLPESTTKSILGAANNIVGGFLSQARQEANAAQQAGVQHLTRGLGGMGQGLENAINGGAYFELAQECERSLDWNGAIEYYNLAAQHGDQRAIALINQIKQDSRPQPTRQITTTSTSPLTPEECFKRGNHCYNAGNPQEAIGWWKMAGPVGDGMAYWNIAICCQNGEGCAPSDSETRRYVELAAAAGFGRALALAGRYFMLDSPADYGRAYDTLLKAVEADKHPDQGRACFDIGLLYREGLGRQPNATAARTWFERALTCGFAEAEAELTKLNTPLPSNPAAVSAPAHGDGNPHARGSLPWAYWELGLAPGVSRQDITLRWRKLMRAGAHPDKGGDDDFAADLNLAKDVLLAALTA